MRRHEAARACVHLPAARIDPGCPWLPLAAAVAAVAWMLPVWLVQYVDNVANWRKQHICYKSAHKK